MSEHANIYVALAAAQSEMGAAVKNATNPAFHSKYADLASVVDAVREPLTKNGIAYSCVIDPGDQRDFMVTTLTHGATGTYISCPVPLIVSKHDMLGYKSACTYAKRIGIESVTGLPTEDDDGNAAVKNPPAQSRTRKRTADTGEVTDPNADKASYEPEIGNENSFRSGQTFVDQVYARCSKGENSPPNEKARKTADLLIEKIRGYESVRGVASFLAEHQKTIASLHSRFPNICKEVIDAQNAHVAWIEAGKPDHVGSEFGLPA